MDVNLFHDMITDRSITAVLQLVNQTPIDWYAKKKAMVDTATFQPRFMFQSKFVAVQTAVDQVIDL